MTEPIKTLHKSEVQEPKGEITYTPLASADTVKLSIAIVKMWLCKPTKSGAVCSDSDAMRFMMLCRARRLNPFEGDAHLVGYDGRNGPEFSLITAHQAFLKRAEPQPSFKGMDSGVIVSPGSPCKACDGGFRQVGDTVERCKFCHGSGIIDEVQGDVVPPEQTLVGGWAHLDRDGWTIPVHRRLSLKAYKPSYENKFWGDNPAGQIVKCAEADVLRSSYPTLLGGLYNGQESAFAMVAKDAGGALSSISPPANARQISAPIQRQVIQRKGPTLVEEPLSNSDEAAEAAAGLAPAQPGPVTQAPAAQASSAVSIQSRLADIVTGAGFDFDDFLAWGQRTQGAGDEATGPLDWGSYGSFDEIPSKAASLFVRAKTGMLAGISGGAS